MAQTITIFLNTTAQTGGITATVNGLKGVQEQTEKLDGWLKRAGASLLGMAAGVVSIHAVTGALRRAVEMGIRFNATLEDSQVGIAAVIKQFNPGQFENFSDAMRVAGNAIEELKRKAVQSPAGFQELVQGFQAISGAATSAGISIRDQVDLVVLMSQALSGIGIRPEQLIQESRALITGNINHNALAAKTLDITREQIMQAKEQGRLYEFLRERLSAFAEAGEHASKNFTVAFSNLTDIIEQRLAVTALPIFESLKRGALELMEVIEGTDIAGAFEGIAGAIAKVVEWSFDLARFGVRNVEVFTNAIESLNVALGVLVLRTAVVFAPSMMTRGAGMMAWFAAINKTVAGVSRFAGPLAGVVAAFSTLGGSVAILGSAVAGWNVGKMLGNFKLFGETINNEVTYKSLLALRAWEKLKLSIGLGSESMLAGIQKSIDDMTSPPAQAKQGGLGESAAPVNPPEVATAAEDFRARLEENALRIARVNHDATISERTRNRDLAAIYKERLQILEDSSKRFEGIPRSVAMDDGTVRVTKEYAEAAGELHQILTEIERLNREIFDIEQSETFFGRLTENLRLMGEEFDNLGATMADVLVNGIRSAIDTVAYGMWQVIDGTATWGDLFRNVARGIISDLIKIALQEILLDSIKRGIAATWRAFVSMMRKSDVAEHNATELAKTPALATNATLASISSWGLAVVIGIAAIAAILASVGAFQEGGVVRGGEQLIRVNEAGTEAVLNAHATSMLGEDTINALNRGVMPEGGIGADGGMQVAAAPAQGGGPSSITLILVDDLRSRSALEAIESSAGQAKIIKIVQDQKTEVGIS